MMFNTNSTLSFADSYNSDQKNSAVNSEEEYILEKQRLAELMYEAVVSGNNESASQYKEEMNRLEKIFLGENIALNEDNTEVASAYSVPPPSYYFLSNSIHYPQDEYYYCGPATAKMMLHIHGINKTQSFLAGSNYLCTDAYGETPWFISNHTDTNDCLMAKTLNSLQSVYYITSPFGANAGKGLTVDQCKAYVMSAVSSGHCVAVCGTSQASGSSHMPNYPNSVIGHWLVIDGYYSNGAYMYILDPAKSSKVSWSNNITARYIVSAETLQAFIGWKGIVW